MRITALRQVSQLAHFSRHHPFQEFLEIQRCREEMAADAETEV